jgi:hypothetical protein
MVVAGDRVPAELGRRYREDARAGAEVGQRAGGLAGGGQLEQVLEAEAGGRVGAGAEGSAGVDDDIDRALAGRLPGGAEPEAVADEQRLVEVLPAVGPVVGHPRRDQLDQAVAGRGLDLAQLGQLALAAVDRVLDVALAALLLDAVGRQHGQLGEHLLGQLGDAADREADQPKKE